MAHTVIWMATVYFTAFVGCAFSSPRYTADASTDDVTQSSVDVDAMNETSPATVVTDNVTVVVEQQNSTSADNLDHDRGRLRKTESNNQPPSTQLPDLDDQRKFYVTNQTDQCQNCTDAGRKNHTSGNDADQTYECPNCKPWRDFKEELEQRHVESLKQFLLAKLRMDSPPVLSQPIPALPLMELQGGKYLRDEPRPKYRSMHVKNFYAKTVQIFVMGKDETHRCIHRKSTGCYYFDVDGKVSPHDVATAELWIYKLFNHNDPYIQTFFFHELERGNRNNKRRPRRMRDRRIQTKMKSGWLKIDVKKTVIRWLQHPGTNEGVSILCKGCQRKDYRKIFSTKNDTMPFIVIQTKKGRRHRRLGRGLPHQCTATSTDCCLAPLEIDFNEIGWSGVVAPRKLKANYCTGSCHAPYASHGNHSELIQAYRWSQSSRQNVRELTPCCSPISYAQQSLMYVDASGAYRVVVVPNIQATACGCL